MAGFSSIIEGCRNIYCDSPVFVKMNTDIINGLDLSCLSGQSKTKGG